MSQQKHTTIMKIMHRIIRFVKALLHFLTGITGKGHAPRKPEPDKENENTTDNL